MAIRLTRKKVVLGIAVFIVVLLVGVLGWTVFYRGQKAVGMKAVVVPVDDVPPAALSYARSGDIDSGLAYYDSQIEQRKDTNDKRRLLLYKADFALSFKRYKEAVSAAKQADSIKSDLTTIPVLARAYEGSGDKQQAVAYYKKALSLAPKDGAGSRSNGLWEQKIKELAS